MAFRVLFTHEADACRRAVVTAVLWLCVAAASPLLAQSRDCEASISAGACENGVVVHRVTSEYQSAETNIRVLLPDCLQRGVCYPVLYVLPVDVGDGVRWGDGLQEIVKHDLHNRHRFICVAPTFAQLPWYADHPTDRGIRQETYLLNVVLPFIERTYPARCDADGRLLLGFSKSGWGAWSLLLRHPETFGKAAAWDAPLMMSAPGKYGSGPIFGTQENFDAYHVAGLARSRADVLRTRSRLVLTGYSGFREEHVAMHALLTELEIPHDYRDGPKLKHDWHSGWVREAVELLAGCSR